MPYNESKTIHLKLMGAEHILLVPHQNPDGDTLSSVCAFMQYLKTHGRTHTAFCSTAVPKNMDFLPHFERVSTDSSIFEKYKFAAVCTFDAGDIDYAGVGQFLRKLNYKPLVINFDHHISNKRFGDFNIIDADASSTTMVLYNYFKRNEIEIDRFIATCLLTGLMTDTETFTNSATKSITLEIGGNLIRRGGNFGMIKQRILKDKTIPGLKFWGIILERLYRNAKHNAAITYIKLSDMGAQNLSEGDLDGVSNFLKMAENTNIIVFLKEIPGGKIKGSMRTASGNTDVAKIAVELGGGGHKKAAGFTVEGRILENNGGIFIQSQNPKIAVLNDLIQKI